MTFPAPFAIIWRMDKLRIAVIGAGRLGAIHCRIYKELDNAELVAVCDIDKARAEVAAKTYETRACFDYKFLLNQVDAVSIAAPTNLHYEIGRYFLSHGIHALIEKPFTPNLKEADHLIKIARKNKLILQVGHVERFNSAFSAVKSIIQNPQFIECHRLSTFPNRSLDIGAVLDIMIHDIDIVLGLVNSPLKKVESVGIAVLTQFEDIANTRLCFKNGCVANLTASRVSDEAMRKIRIFQKNTYISLDYKEAEASVYRKDGTQISKENLPIEKEEPLKKELASFVQCVLNRKEPLVSGEVARQALALALKIQKQIWQK